MQSVDFLNNANLMEALLLEFAPCLSQMLQGRTVDECRQDLRITKDYSPLDLSVVAPQNDWLSRAII